MKVDRERLNKERLRSARTMMKELDLDVFVATCFDNVRYLTDRRAFFVTGWEPNAIAVLPKDGDPLFVHGDEFIAPSPWWEKDGARLKKTFGWNHFPVFNTSIVPELWMGWTEKAVKKLGLRKGRLGLDRAPWQWYSELRRRLDGFDIVDAEEAILLARAVKNEEEVKILLEAGKVASKGVEAGLKAVKAGVREYEVYGSFMKALYEQGSEGDGFFPFLTSGPITEGAFYPTNRKLQAGDPVIMDMGPIIDGYNGDCMRTGFVGKPTEAFAELYRTVHDAMYAAIDAIRPGVRTSQLDAKARRVMRARDYLPPRFDFGHGIGLNCCELPVLMHKEAYPVVGKKDIVLKPRMFFTCEPRLHKTLRGQTYIQCALEESIMVTDAGHKVITSAPFIEELIA